VQRQVGVAEDDRVGIGEAGAEALDPALRGAGVVDDRDRRPLGVEADGLGQLAAELGAVDVSLHGDDGADLAQLGEHARLVEVSRVDDQVGVAELREAAIRKPARPPRHVGVGDDREPHA
jgi:hypothetical protein